MAEPVPHLCDFDKSLAVLGSPRGAQKSGKPKSPGFPLRFHLKFDEASYFFVYFSGSASKAGTQPSQQK